MAASRKSRKPKDPAEGGAAPRESRRQPERLHPRHREVQAAVGGRGEGARPAHPRGRPGGPRAPGGGEPALRRPLREALPRARACPTWTSSTRGASASSRRPSASTPSATSSSSPTRCGGCGRRSSTRSRSTRASSACPRSCRARSRASATLRKKLEAELGRVPTTDELAEKNAAVRLEVELGRPPPRRRSRGGRSPPRRRSTSSCSPAGTTCRSRPRSATTATSSSATPSSRRASPPSRWS